MRVAPYQGWLAVPAPDGVYEFSGEERSTDDGSTEWVYTLRLVPEASSDEHEATVRGLSYRKRYGPPLSCEEIDMEISARKAREARSRERRVAKAAEAQKPDEPRMRLV